ncbi:MAG: hypothetical protein IPJ71_03325 [Bdellovibrionales bacterium]|nr:hypothetical protein [Bdellovibrionales bacterium]
MKITFGLSLSLLALGLTACSGGGGGGGGSGPENAPQSKEEALQRLSPQHKANFEAWQSKVVKACDSADAFGLHKENKMEQDGIDGAALIKMNSGSVVFSDGKNLAILAGYNSFSGVGNTKTEETLEVNGQGYTVSAETKREGSTCSVFLFGQKVYETGIAESFIIGTQYSPYREASATSQIPVVKNLGVNGAGEVVQHGIYALLSQTLKPSKEAQAFVGQIFGLNAEQSAKLFRLTDYTSADSAVRIDSDQSSVWSNSECGNLISQASGLKIAFDGTLRVLNLEVRLQVPQFDFKGTKNTEDNGNLKLTLSSTIIKKDNGFLYNIKSLQNDGLVLFSQAEAETCTKDRVTAYSGAFARNYAISPSTQVMFSPCRTIFPEIENVSYKNGLLKSLIPIVFANVTPASQFQYGGWDLVLSRFAKEVVSQNKDIVSELDPSAKTKIVGIASKHLEAIKIEMDKSKNILPLTDTALQMGLDWSFQGTIVSASRISQIIQSADNSSDIFKISTERLLNDLARNPNANDDQLSFALSIDGNVKSEAMKALNLSKDLNYSKFEIDVFNQAIQKKVTIEEFRSWSDRFATIKTEIDKYPAVFSVKNELIGSSLKWLKNGEVATQDLAGIYSAINNSIDPFAESTKQLVLDLGQSLAGNKEALEFARNIKGEYKQLALSIRSNSIATEYEKWGSSFFNSVLQKRPTIEQLRQWNDLWVSSLHLFNAKKKELPANLGHSLNGIE